MRFQGRWHAALNEDLVLVGPTQHEVEEDLNPHEHRQHYLQERGADAFMLYMRHTRAGWAAESSVTVETSLFIGQATGCGGMLGAAAEALAAPQAQAGADLTPWLE